MTLFRNRMLTASALVAAIALSIPTARAQSPSRFDELATLPFEQNRPTEKTAQTLKEELLFQRATQAYLWAMPLINTLGMKNGSEKVFGAGYNVLPVWKKRLDAKTLVTTPNSDVIYAMNYLDVGRDGPLVFEAAPGLQGILLDVWQRPIPGPSQNFQGDVGFFGPDKGKGGKYLILPPGYDKPVPDGYFVYRSATNNVFVFLRSFYQDPSDLTPAVKIMEATKIYPLGRETSARAMQFLDASGVSANMLPVNDGSVFEHLKQLIDSEVTDGAGASLSGDVSYRVKLPPNVPAANFWSLTLYEAANASGLANGQPFPSLGSRDKPVLNADGSTDLYLGPTEPKGHERNWLRTVPGNGYFAILRLYGPTEAAIDKSWKPGDFEKQ